MQLVTVMAQILESGKVTLSTKNKEFIEIKAENKKIDVNAKNKELIKDIISRFRDREQVFAGIEKAKESVKAIKTLTSTREILIDIAKELKVEGITVTLSYKGNVVATIGAQASSKFSRLVTGTRAVEINSLLKLIELGL